MILWVPVSACGPYCLPARGATPTVHIGLRTLRLIAAGLVLAAGTALVPLSPRSCRPELARRWARAMLGALGVRVVVRGRMPRRRALVVANHVSWLDILVLLSLAPTRLVAKCEVRGWPGIGALAAAAGSIFIDRSRPRSLPGTVAEVGAALRTGALVSAFPEGTTWCGEQSGRYRPALFQAALDAGAAVVPVTLRFRAGDAGTTAPAFLGDDTLVASLCRILAVRGLTVQVAVTPALYAEPGTGRRDLARLAAAA